MSAAPLALVALIGWLIAVQSRRAGLDRSARSSFSELGTTVALVAGAAVLVGQELGGDGAGPRVDPTAVAMVALTGWCVGLQTMRAGRDRSGGTSPSVLVTTVVLGAGTVLVVVPHLYSMVT